MTQMSLTAAAASLAPKLAEDATRLAAREGLTPTALIALAAKMAAGMLAEAPPRSPPLKSAT